ncbi:GNAT family N-acetyltransferase [Bacterioplanoides sp.]|uniref:GNAT family N-acetyltransferase n=1 Tax=Bacterioplanoides sp. TaxID=2066072 RepID=UPI003B5B8E05
MMTGINPNISFRKALKTDLHKVYEFEASYIRELEPENYQRWAQAKDKNFSLLQDNLANMLIAETSNTLVGYGYWSILNQLPHIFSIYVVPEFRNQKVAHQLLLKLEKQIQQHGYTQSELMTLEFNPARQFFIKHGYAETGINNSWVLMKKSQPELSQITEGSEQNHHQFSSDDSEEAEG